jgi:hypothetical protein
MKALPASAACDFHHFSIVSIVTPLLQTIQIINVLFNNASFLEKEDKQWH